MTLGPNFGPNSYEFISHNYMMYRIMTRVLSGPMFRTTARLGPDFMGLCHKMPRLPLDIAKKTGYEFFYDISPYYVQNLYKLKILSLILEFKFKFDL